MNYQETLRYLFAQLPMYQRVGTSAFKKDLTNIRKLCEALGNPQEEWPAIHVAGTNGKGSVSSLIASVLTAAGYKVGLYTSPHLLSFTERIRIDGVPMSEEAVVDWVEAQKELLETIQPSFFETTVAMAFDHFQKEKVDVALIETGLGGRLDSTNILKSPLLSVITNISLDHQAMLGDTLEAIAGEKAGIIKENVPVVIGRAEGVVREVFQNTANQKNAPLVFARDEYQVSESQPESLTGRSWTISGSESKNTFNCPLLGDYQGENLCTVQICIDLLNQKSSFSIDLKAQKRGIERVVKLAGLRGRMEVLSEKPLTVTDVAHNEAGVSAILNQLERWKPAKIHFVWGMVNDKEIGKILRMLPSQANFYFVRPDVPRGLEAGLLAESAKEAGLEGQVYESVEKGIRAAQKAARSNDLIYIGGSTFVVAEALPLF